MAASERKRPWYLVLALLLALAFGANGARTGWTTVALYHEPINPAVAVQGYADEADRAAVVARLEALLAALDKAKARGWPLAVGTLLLGTAALVLAMRAFAGSSGARTALVQVILAQAALNVLAYAGMKDVSQAEIAFQLASENASIHEQMTDKAREEERTRAYDAVVRIVPATALALHLLGSALIVLALTRRRSREFFDPTGAAVRER